MAQVITIAGERLFALKAQNNQQLDIDTFIFAFVPGQDSSAPIDRNEGLPPIGQRVHSQIVQQTGLINENAVVYSTVLDSLTGPFDFNWVGLYSSVNQTLIGIIHTPTVSKTVTVPGAAGNILNRNFVIEYSGIAELTGITVDAETWQLDYTARLNGMDELTRQLAADMNGKDWFIEDGFKVVPRSTLNTFKVTAGVGYVSGLRVTLAADHILTLSSYPQFVYVDAWFDGTSDSVWKGHTAFTVTNTEMDDYIDVNGRNHYVFKLARITAADEVEDFRNNKGLKESIDKIKEEIKVVEFSMFEKYDQAAKIGNILCDGVYSSDHVVFEILLTGDSTMRGAIPFNTTEQDPKHPGVALKQAIDLIYPGNLVTVNNAARSGTTLKQLLNGTDGGVGTYAERLAAAGNTKIVYCNHCLNDCGSYESDASEYRENIVRFVNITRAYNKIPVLVTPSLISPLEDGREDQSHRQSDFIQAMRDTANIMGVDIVDNFYFTQKSSSLYKPHDIAPDGVHLSQFFYQQSGWNLAIPLINAHVLYKAGDIAGLSTAKWNDNITNSRGVWYMQSSRFSTMMTGDAIASFQYINYPIVLDSPTNDTVLGVGGAVTEFGGVGQLTYFGNEAQPQFDGIIQYKAQAPDDLNYDMIFMPRNCALPAGLSIVGVKINTAISPIPNVNFTFSGLQLLKRVESGFGTSVNSGFQLLRSIGVRDQVKTAMQVKMGAIFFELKSTKSPFETKVKFYWDSVSNKVVLTTPSGSVDVWPTPQEGYLNCSLVFLDDGSVLAQIGGISAQSAAAGYNIGTLFVANEINYFVVKS